MFRKIDELGRIVIPMGIRKELKIKSNDKLKIDVKDENIILTKVDSFNLENWLEEKLEKELNTMKRFAFKEVLEVIRNE